MENAFELRDVSAGYSAKAAILKNITLSIPSGKITAILGANGSGKSTLLRVLSGQLRLSEGALSVFGQDCTKFSRRDFATHIACVVQSRNVPSCTVEELLLCARFPHKGVFSSYSASDKKIVCDVLKRLSLSDFASQKLSTLSGGQRQKVYIAMALAQDTNALLLDEPLSFLDIARQFEIMDLLKNIADEGKTVVLVSHDLTLALEYANKIAVLEHGNLSFSGNPDESAVNALNSVFDVCAKRVILSDGKPRFVFSPKSQLF